MIKSHLEIVQRTEQVIDEIQCNYCGGSIYKVLWRNELGESQYEIHDHIEIDKEWGYNSDKDGDKHKAHICESCYDKFTSLFVIPVEVKHTY